MIYCMQIVRHKRKKTFDFFPPGVFHEEQHMDNWLIRHTVYTQFTREPNKKLHRCLNNHEHFIHWIELKKKSQKKYTKLLLSRDNDLYLFSLFLFLFKKKNCIQWRARQWIQRIEINVRKKCKHAIYGMFAVISMTSYAKYTQQELYAF